MANWTYQCYDDGKLPNRWQRWFDDHFNAQGAHDNAFDMLENMDTWREPNSKHLGEGLVEVRFKGEDKLQWRVFGFFQKGQRQVFVVVASGYHQQKKYYPSGIIEKSRVLKLEIELGKAKVVSCARPK
jgi:hypothetical protein